MARVLLAPKYSDEYGRLGNRPCTPEVAEKLEAKALAIALRANSSEFIDATLMSTPRHAGFIVLGRRKQHKRKLVANTSVCHLKLVYTPLRTYGVDINGKLFVGREYPELHGMVFVPMHPLMQSTLDLSVLENELMNALDAALT